MIASLLSLATFLFGPRKPEDPSLPLGSNDLVTLHQLYEGMLVFGSTGSGKTTGPGEAVIRYLLRMGCGILWLTAKADEYERAHRLCRQTNRLGDLVRFAPEAGHSFNFLDFELTSPGGGVNSAAQLLQDLVEFSTRASASQSSDPFWQLSAARLLRMALVICAEARTPCSVEHLYRFLTSLPSKESLHDPAWRDSFAAKSIGLAADRQPRSPDFDLAATYLLEEWPNLADRTASSVLAQAMVVVDRFMSGGMARLVAGERSTITPLDLEQGKVIVLDVPVLRYSDAGRQAQVTMKLAAYRSLLRRDVTKSPRPVAVIADEGQLFAVPRMDAATQAVGRSARLINVVLTQNVPLVIGALGGPGMENEAYSWIGNFSTKLFCSNTDKQTNDFASGLCGNAFHLLFSGSGGPTEPYNPVDDLFGRQSKSSFSFQQNWRPDIPPEVFVSQLRRGGKAANFVVDAVACQAGRRFSNDKPWLVAPFKQDFS